ncbi:MAG: VCBS repeat-containing protein [Cyclobacteriaceae bacterium]
MKSTTLFCFLSISLILMLNAQTPKFETKTSQVGLFVVSSMEEEYGHGISASDFDGDGDIDFYACANVNVPNKLYRNDGDGSFTDVAELVGLDLDIQSRASLWFDYDADRLLDLVVVGEQCFESKDCEDRVSLNLFKQLSSGNFVDVTESAGLVLGDKYDGIGQYAIGGLSAGDLNSDGYLDLLLTMWFGKTSLFVNNTDGTFSDRSESSGIGLEDYRSWQSIITDVNLDGKQDIYICIDGGPNQTWINDGSLAFHDMAEELRMDSPFSEMGVTIGDYDNDGDFDFYTTNITTGGAGNHLLKNAIVNEKRFFVDAADPLGVKLSGWDWGCTFADINNDGWQDLAITNGNLNWPKDQSQLWINDEGRFVNVSDESMFNDELNASSLIAFDADRDGDLDYLQSLQGSNQSKIPVIYYENQLEESETQNNFICIQPRMSSSKNYYGIGSVVKIVAGDLSQMRQITSGTSFYAQEPAEAFFGLGDRSSLDEVRIEWPDGNTSVYNDVVVNQVVTLWDEVIEKPTGLSVERDSEKVSLTWVDNSENETGFDIQYSKNPDFVNFESVKIGSDESSVNLTEIDLFSSWYFRVRAFNGIVNSLFTETVMSEGVPLSSEQRLQEQDVLNISPNSNDGSFQVSLNSPFKGQVSLNLYDLTGRKIETRKIYKKEIQQVFEFSFDLRPANYLLNVQMGDFSTSSRLIVR